MPVNKKYLDVINEIDARATTHAEAGDYEQAYAKQKEALYYLNEIIRFETDPQTKRNLDEVLKRLLKREEELKQKLASKNRNDQSNFTKPVIGKNTELMDTFSITPNSSGTTCDAKQKEALDYLNTMIRIETDPQNKRNLDLASNNKNDQSNFTKPVIRKNTEIMDSFRVAPSSNGTTFSTGGMKELEKVLKEKRDDVLSESYWSSIFQPPIINRNVSLSHSHSSSDSFVSKAIEIVSMAIKYDNEGNYEQAYIHYKRSLEYLLNAIESETNPSTQSILNERFQEYLRRAEELKKVLDEQNHNDFETSNITPSHSHSSSNSFLDKGLEIVSMAIKYDNEGNYEQAHIHYKRSLEYMLNAIKFETNPSTQSILNERFEGYLKRTEQLKKVLEESKH